MSNKKKYTYAEVGKHNKPNDCWLVIEDKVYDVSDYLNQHPGGPIVLTTRAGKIVTTAFDQASHSKHAKEQILPTKCIGQIDKTSEPEIWQVEPTSKSSPIALVVLLLAIVAIVYYMTQ